MEAWEVKELRAWESEGPQILVRRDNAPLGEGRCPMAGPGVKLWADRPIATTVR